MRSHDIITAGASSSKGTGLPGAPLSQRDKPRSELKRVVLTALNSSDDLDSDDSPLSSPLSSLPPSPIMPPAVARARAPSVSGPLASILRHPTAVPLARSASRSSIKSTSKGAKKDSRKGSMKEIECRLQETGGIVTRYGEQVSCVVLLANHPLNAALGWRTNIHS